MSLWKRRPLAESNPLPERVLPQTPIEYPVGTFVHTPTGNRYLIQRDGKKYRVTDTVYYSWNFPLQVLTSDAALAAYPTAITRLGFRDGTLLTNIADGKMYLVSDYTRRHITNPDVLDRLGIEADQFILVSDDEIKIMKQGKELN